MSDRTAASGGRGELVRSRLVTSILGIGAVGGTIGAQVANWEPRTAAWIFVGTALATDLQLMFSELRRAVIARPTSPARHILHIASIVNVLLAVAITALLITQDVGPVSFAVGVLVATPGAIVTLNMRSWWGPEPSTPAPIVVTTPEPGPKRSSALIALAGLIVLVVLIGLAALMPTTSASDDTNTGVDRDDEAAGPVVTVPSIPDDGAPTTVGPTTTDVQISTTTEAPTTTTTEETTTTDVVSDDLKPPIQCHEIGQGAPPQIRRSMVDAWNREQESDGPSLDCMVTRSEWRGGAWTQFSQAAVMLVARRGRGAFTVDPAEVALYGPYAGPQSDLVTAVDDVGPPVLEVVYVNDGMIMVVSGGSPMVYESHYALLTLRPGGRRPHLLTDEFEVEWLTRGGPCPEGIGWPTNDERAAGQEFERDRLVKNRDGLVGATSELRAGAEPHPVDVDGAPWEVLLAALQC